MTKVTMELQRTRRSANMATDRYGVRAVCRILGSATHKMASNTKQVSFQHAVFTGSAYEVGEQQGEIVKQIPPLKEWFCSGAAPDGDVAQIRKQCDVFCPGLNDELQGCADTLQVPVERLVYYIETHLSASHCSHFAVLPALTTNQHLLVGRNYDFSDTMDDLSFFTMRITGKYAHIGFPALWLGRDDGMNEHGLVVTMSTGGIPVGRHPGQTPPIQNGFMFWALVRTLLEQCRTVDEALALIERFPCCGNPILIIADQQGNAAVVEIWGSQHGVTLINAVSAKQFIGATNHFTLPAMIPYAPYMMNHSRNRYNTIATRLQQAAPQISSDTVRGILSDPYPTGLCAHYYEEFFGTLHSIIFDATAVTAEVCFGSPHVNPWHQFDLRQPADPGSYTVTLPLEHAAPEFWERIAL